ncbi:hypothetical protein CYFUS_009830 [Cystobacter fuscus]|uniref:Disintegrin domain-containing protein n=1 Tax=Cystobacter fuscus TaxID=43 RepID=A0A250JL14_9BACT|nr:hypothetical protein [Cystobacter fuscus]ATB44343.1 hypothetical protein CYFUS_009830 [Cystobacter fuscus]
MGRGVWGVLVGVWMVLGCGPSRSEECAPEWGWPCTGGRACVEGVCVEDPDAGPPCVVGATRACEEGCAGIQTCGSGGTWGPCETCGEGQRCEGRQCVCDSTSCAGGCCQGNTCLPGTAPTACGTGGVACVMDAQCGKDTPRCEPGSGTCVCVKSEPRESQCGDGRDNDCDGLVDCADPDCGARACGAQGQTCGGSACVCPGGSTERACGDGQDNDCDGLVDCRDPDCEARTCRAAAGVCDQEEVCGAGVCPGDRRVGPDVVCRPSRGMCDVEERCDGVGVACPGDRKVAAGSVCQPSTGGCDPAEVCDGVSPACPVDRYLPAGQVCRAAAGVCDSAARCSGTSGVCPDNAVDHARCDDGKACTIDFCATNGSCQHVQKGVCI